MAVTEEQLSKGQISSIHKSQKKKNSQKAYL